MPNSPTPPRFRRLLLNAIFVPLVLMLCIAVLLLWQIDRLLVASALANHSDEVIAKAYDLQRLTVDLETGLRGFLVTGDEDFLAPYEKSSKVINEAASQLSNLIIDSPRQHQILTEITNRRNEWLNYAQGQIVLRRQGGNVVAVARERRGKELMDGIRDRFATLIGAETLVREQRDEHVKRASRVTLVLTGIAALLGGAVLSVLSRGQFIRLIRTYDSALQTAHELNLSLENRVVARTRELQERSEQLAEVNKELEAFAYSISHDLRAPMRHITGFADLIRTSMGPTLSVADQENLNIIYDTAKLAGRMVDDLLSFSRVGRAHLKCVNVDVNELIAQCRRELAPDTAGRDIDWHVGNLLPAWGDYVLLKMVFQNLLSNAVKYTGKESKARIEVGSTESRTDTIREVTYFVRDNGVGFDMQFSGKLFGVFQRLHRTEEFEGTGIGLANVRRIIIRHGGRIRVEAAPNEGATFFLTLPMAPDKQVTSVSE